MDINKIIREGLSGFDWVDEIGSGLAVGQTYDITAKNGFKYQLIYCGKGTTIHPNTKQKIEGHRFRDFHSDKCNSWWSEDTLLGHVGEDRIKLVDTIKESDFGWVEEVPLPDIHNGTKIKTPNGNILTVIDFDEEDVGEGFNRMVKWKVRHNGSWLEFSDMYTSVHNRIKNGYWSIVGETVESKKILNQAPSTLQESDFGWMVEVDHLDYDNLLGKGMLFDPPITTPESLDNVLEVLEGIGVEIPFSSEYIDFDENDFGDTDVIVGLYVSMEGRVVWTSDVYEDYKEHIEDYAGIPVEILNGRNLFSSSLNESFEWVEDIPEHGLYDGMKFTNGPYRSDKTKYTLNIKNFSDNFVNVSWELSPESGGGVDSTDYILKDVLAHFEGGHWIPFK